MPAVALNLEWGGDWTLDEGGNLQLVTGSALSRQFIIRNLLTRPAKNPISGLAGTPDYLFDTGYGIGAGTLVDQLGTSQFQSSLIGAILEAIKSDPGVALLPIPQVSLTFTPGGLLNIFATFTSKQGILTTFGLQSAAKGIG